MHQGNARVLPRLDAVCEGFPSLGSLLLCLKLPERRIMEGI